MLYYRQLIPEIYMQRGVTTINIKIIIITTTATIIIIRAVCGSVDLPVRGQLGRLLTQNKVIYCQELVKYNPWS